jgi:riboflavin synthase
VFTGIIREVGTVEAMERGDDGARIRIATGLDGELRDGDSVAVAGACLTVAARGAGTVEADVMNQTLSLTTLGQLAPGDGVNLEPALRAGEPLGGHLVQGHVDGTGEVSGVREDGIARRLAIAVPAELRGYLIERGSVTVDGVSLTVVALAPDGFEVSLIPETLERTTLGGLAAGDRVNLEMDVIARYAERLVQGLSKKGNADG